MKRAFRSSLAGLTREFRLQRNHLAQTENTALVSIARDVCGLQAQITPAAFLRAWARNHAITRSEIEDALWKKRTLVKTSLMRQALHLIPADEFSLYTTALKSSRVSGALRIMPGLALRMKKPPR